jgi:hypothetical protein
MGSAQRRMRRNTRAYTKATGIGFVNAAQILRPGMLVITLRRDMPDRLPPGIDIAELALRWGEFGLVKSRTDETVDVVMVSDLGKPTGEIRTVKVDEIFATYGGGARKQ